MDSSTRIFFKFVVTARIQLYTLSLHDALPISPPHADGRGRHRQDAVGPPGDGRPAAGLPGWRLAGDRKSTRLNSSHSQISYAVFCLKKKISSYGEAFLSINCRSSG